MTFLKGLFGPTETPVALVEHSILGVLQCDGESETWGKIARVAGHEVRLSVTGQTAPDQELIARLVTVESGTSP